MTAARVTPGAHCSTSTSSGYLGIVGVKSSARRSSRRCRPRSSPPERLSARSLRRTRRDIVIITPSGGRVLYDSGGGQSRFGRAAFTRDYGRKSAG